MGTCNYAVSEKFDSSQVCLLIFVVHTFKYSVFHCWLGPGDRL